MHILIVGVNHQIQPAAILSGSTSGNLEAFERSQKEAFAELLRLKMAKYDVEFVGEEARHGQRTVTMNVCDAARCRYVNIEMPPEERAARGIPPGYNENLCEISESEKPRFNREREDYMMAKTVEASNARSILVICGSLHATALAAHFREARQEVEVVDLHDQGWYVRDWQYHMMYNLD